MPGAYEFAGVFMEKVVEALELKTCAGFFFHGVVVFEFALGGKVKGGHWGHRFLADGSNGR
jgi:hypothetical protein